MLGVQVYIIRGLGFCCRGFSTSMRFVQYEGCSEAQEEGGAVHEEHVEHTVPAAAVGGRWLVVGGWLWMGCRRRFH